MEDFGGRFHDQVGNGLSFVERQKPFCEADLRANRKPDSLGAKLSFAFGYLVGLVFWSAIKLVAPPKRSFTVVSDEDHVTTADINWARKFK